jgi:hypothetical protein
LCSKLIRSTIWEKTFKQTAIYGLTVLPRMFSFSLFGFILICFQKQSTVKCLLLRMIHSSGARKRTKINLDNFLSCT